MANCRSMGFAPYRPEMLPAPLPMSCPKQQLDSNGGSAKVYDWLIFTLLHLFFACLWYNFVMVKGQPMPFPSLLPRQRAGGRLSPCSPPHLRHPWFCLEIVQNFSWGGGTLRGVWIFCKGAWGGVSIIYPPPKKNRTLQNAHFMQFPLPPWMPLWRNSSLLPWKDCGTLGEGVTHFWQRL